MTTNKNVDHPAHYSGKIECIDAMREAIGIDGVIAFCRGNAFKYIWRAERKGKCAEDMEKAAWYCNKAAELLKECGHD